MADAADIADKFVETNLQNSLARVSMQTAANADNIECEDCGHDISAARRNAAPWASTCIECQSAREKRQRQYR